MRPAVLVLLPLLNEAGTISRLLADLSESLDGRPHTICVIDDGSVDGTIEAIRAAAPAADGRIHLIQRTKERAGCQRGSALKAGLDWGVADPRFQIFVEIDGDLSHRVEELPHGVERIASGRADVAIASKYLPGSQVLNRPAGRQLVSSICSLATSLLLSPSIRDYSNGYRFYNRRAAMLVTAHRIRYGSPIYLSEVLALWLSNDLRVVEFPSIYIGRNEGLSKLRLIDLLKASVAVPEISLRYHLTGFAHRSAAGVGSRRSLKSRRPGRDR